MKNHTQIWVTWPLAIFENLRWRTAAIFKTALSQPSIIRFRSSLVLWCKFTFRGWTFDKKSKFCKFKIAYGRHIENHILAVSRRHIGRLMPNLEQRWRIAWRYGRITKMAIFENSRWRTAAILKIASSPYLHNLSRELSDFDQIWYADANFHSEDGHLTKDRNFAKSR